MLLLLLLLFQHSRIAARSRSAFQKSAWCENNKIQFNKQRHKTTTNKQKLKKKIKTTSSSSSSSSSLRTGHKRGVAHTHVRTVVRLPVEHAIARVHQSERDERSFLHVRRRVGRE